MYSRLVGLGCRLSLLICALLVLGAVPVSVSATAGWAEYSEERACHGLFCGDEINGWAEWVLAGIGIATIFALLFTLMSPLILLILLLLLLLKWHSKDVPPELPGVVRYALQLNKAMIVTLSFCTGVGFILIVVAIVLSLVSGLSVDNVSAAIRGLVFALLLLGIIWFLPTLLIRSTNKKLVKLQAAGRQQLVVSLLGLIIYFPFSTVLYLPILTLLLFGKKTKRLFQKSGIS